jgi:acetolactate decarboxylase
MSGDQKLPGDRNEQGSGNGLAHHHIAIIVGAIVILIIAGGVFLNEAGKNPRPATEKIPADRDVLYQVSTINALVLGIYDGVQSTGDIQKHGDFGIGTFEALDGEMIVVDGKYYQATSDGSVHIVDPSIMVPFATVTFFDNEKSIPLSGGGDLASFTSRIDKALPSKNLVYAIRVDGTFPEVDVRAIPAQKKPYPPLAEAATHQVVTKLKNTTGTIVGFYLPPYMNGVNMPGYHLHYISSDRKSGGHILDLTAPDTPVTVMIDQTADFSMSAPTTGDFPETNLSRDVSQDLRQVERS